MQVHLLARDIPVIKQVINTTENSYKDNYMIKV